VSLLVAVLIVLGVSAVAIAAMLAVRRNAPDGSYFADGDRASGVFGVLATGFSVLLGFIVFLAFSSYDASRAGAEAEALTLAQQVQTAQLLPRPVSAELTGELVCYGRYVVHAEWPRMENDTIGNEINPWGAELFRTIDTVVPRTATEETAYAKWLDQTSDREAARSDRIHGAVGVIPVSLWVVLFFIAGLIFLYVLFFADSGERAVVQALLMGSVVAAITAMLLLLQFLDNPFHGSIGALKPVAMERTLDIVDDALRAVGRTAAISCDATGTPAT